MDGAQFELPVRVVFRAGDAVTEIYSAEQALDVLMGWPVQKGPILEEAMAACLTASADPSKAEDARTAFVSFARASDILAKDLSLESLYENSRLKELRGLR